MDDKDREIIRMLQNGFPLEPEPFKAIGDKLWIDETSVISRLVQMMQEGAIRYIGPFFDSKKLGYTGTLAAMEVPLERLDFVAETMSKYPEITHNYLREGVPNVWFTLTARDESRKQAILEELKQRCGVDKIFTFPARRFFKVRVDQE